MRAEKYFQLFQKVRMFWGNARGGGGEGGLKGKLTGPAQALHLIASDLQLQGMHANRLYFAFIQDLL